MSSVSTDPTAPPASGRRWARNVVMLALPLALAAGGGYAYLTGGRYVATDNAYVQQDKVSISADVSGRIVEVSVRENQRVGQGDVLFRIDPDPYRIALAQAEAAVASARLQVAQLRSTYRGTAVDVRGAREDIAFAQEDFNRQAELLRRGFTTRARYEQASHALQQAREALASAQADAENARVALSGDRSVPVERHPLVLAAHAQRDKAQLDLARTVVRAPRSGIVSQTDRLQVGQVIASGLPAVSLVAADAIWVEANYKETDLAEMRVGQPADIEIDAYPDMELKGRVASIGAGTGAEFSVLPAQNANGNWVKVVQRVPVRIALTTRPGRPLLAGLSAEVTVDTEGRTVPQPPAAPQSPAALAMAAER
jgi:membrane fusion protein (multidrug efflux system)